MALCLRVVRSSPPDKLAPPVVSGYSLVLLERGPDAARVDRALQALAGNPAYASSSSPCVVRRELSLTDALEGQFELICTDSISVFINDAVVEDAKSTYLDELFQALRKSAEFEAVQVRVFSVPDDVDGARFIKQFFGQVIELPLIQRMPRKKARIMLHWGNKLGADIEVVTPAASKS